MVAEEIVDKESIYRYPGFRDNYFRLNCTGAATTERLNTMSTTLQQLPAGTYGVDPVHSSFGFAVKHNGISTFRGQFEQVDAKLDDGVLTGAAQVESVKTPIEPLKDHLLSPEFFDAAQHPSITFRSTDIRLNGDGTVELDGELTMRGVTRTVTATGTYGYGQSLTGAEVVGFDLETTVDRRDYGIEWQAELPNGGQALGWDVTILAHLELAKA
jgi:polyisoprenoid-binding protein YceI